APPVPAFTASASSAFAGDQVDFDATASSDPDGTIDRYEWDLDGNGSFETDTGATPSASRTYLAPASVNVGLRVTDDRGNQRTVSHSLSVLTRAPTATFTVVPGTAAKGATVTFDASLSSATPGRTITDFAWDLDGDGTFETDTGLLPTASRSYTAPATPPIALQPTDTAADRAPGRRRACRARRAGREEGQEAPALRDQEAEAHPRLQGPQEEEEQAPALAGRLSPAAVELGVEHPAQLLRAGGHGVGGLEVSGAVGPGGDGDAAHVVGARARDVARGVADHPRALAGVRPIR